MKSARRRVLFLMPTLGGGGAERVIVTLLRHLDRSRFEPHLALVEAVGPFLTEVPLGGYGKTRIQGSRHSRLADALRPRQFAECGVKSN